MCGRRTRRAAARVSAARPARPIRKGSCRARKEIRLHPLVDIRIYTDRAPCQAASDPSPSSNGPRMVLAITRHRAESTETSLYSTSKTPPNSDRKSDVKGKHEDV